MCEDISRVLMRGDASLRSKNWWRGRQAPAALLNASSDLDAPTFQDLAFVKNKGRTGQGALKTQNLRLTKQVRFT